MILHTGKLDEEETMISLPEIPTATPPMEVNPLDLKKEVQKLTPEERMCQFRELMSEIVGQAVAQNNEQLSQTIGRDVQELVLKEMNYLMREQDEAQEERYRKLDAAIRGNVKRKFWIKKK